jgi:hypothetical protein
MQDSNSSPERPCQKPCMHAHPVCRRDPNSLGQEQQHAVACVPADVTACQHTVWAATHAAEPPRTKERDTAKQVLARPCSGRATERTVGKRCRHKGWQSSPRKASLHQHPKNPAHKGPHTRMRQAHTHSHPQRASCSPDSHTPPSGERYIWADSGGAVRPALPQASSLDTTQKKEDVPQQHAARQCVDMSTAPCQRQSAP